MSTPSRLVLVKFRDGSTARCFRQVTRRPVLPGEPTEFVTHRGRTVWVRAGQFAYQEV